MNQRQEILTRILTEHFGAGINPGNSINRDDLVKYDLYNEVERRYRKLGGILDIVPLKFGGWDIILKDFIVELDETQHFNRYRAITLESFIYHMGKGFDIFDYIKYCNTYEKECLDKSSWGKYWTSPSTEKQFGTPGQKGDLSKNGSPRWKQRAFYDYLRDVFAMIYRFPLIRISVYDKLYIGCGLKSVGNILSENNSFDLNEIVKFIEQKANLF
ncbi:MAG: hypothetical protein JXB49_17025 [Bacteroidales bacterium]|nr:hypothetical protein [Bacteroidales bacterium]